MPKQINEYRFGQQLIRKFGLKGRFQPVLDETFVPVVIVSTETVQKPAFSGGSNTAVGGEWSCSTLENPAGSRVRLLVDQVLVVTASSFMVYTKIGVLWTLGVKTLKTAEFSAAGAAGSPVGQMYVGVTSVSPTLGMFLPTGSTRPCILQPSIPDVLTVEPGEAVQLYTQSTNTANSYGWMWREETINITDQP